jgi:signal transduction histidine kinase
MTETSPEPAQNQEKLEHFAANVAHDFNNLLTGILGNLELMQNRARRTGVTTFDGYLDGARNAGSRAATFAQRLLAFSGRAAQESQPVAIVSLMREIVEPMREHFPDLTAAFAEHPANVFCDPGQVELAVHELLHNAMDAGGQVFAGTEVGGNSIAIIIRDTGKGMDPATLARALEPFYTTQPNGAGKGLGLSIVDRFARQTGGTLEISSQPGTGTTVKLVLPLIV